MSRNRRNRIVERIEVLVVVNLHHMNLALNISLLQSRNLGNSVLEKTIKKIVSQESH